MSILYEIQPFVSAQFDVVLHIADAHLLHSFVTRLPRYRFVAMPLCDDQNVAFRVQASQTLDSILSNAPQTTRALSVQWFDTRRTDEEIDANPRLLSVWIDEQTPVLARGNPARALHIAYSSRFAFPLLRVNHATASVASGGWQLLHQVPPMCACPLQVPCLLENLHECISLAAASLEAHGSLRWLHTWPQQQLATVQDNTVFCEQFVVFELAANNYVLFNENIATNQVFRSIESLCTHIGLLRGTKPPLLLCDSNCASAIRTYRVQRFGVVRAHEWLVCDTDEYVLNASLDNTASNSWSRNRCPAILPHHSRPNEFFHYSYAAMHVIIDTLTKARCRWLDSYNIVDHSIALARTAGMTWSAALQAWPKQVCEALIGTMIAREQHCVVIPLDRSKTTRSTYQGGHVETAQAGLHCTDGEFVALLDSRSHYPSVFIWAKLEPHLCMVFSRLVALRRSEQRGSQYTSVLKYLANSLYGGLAVVDYDTSNLAEQTAQVGRRVLQQAIEHLRQHYSAQQVSIVGGDTDSLLIKIHNCASLDETQQTIESVLLPTLNQTLGAPIQFSLQWIAKSLYMHSKKQYAYIDAADNTVHCKGMEEARGSTALTVQKALSEFTHRVLTDTAVASSLGAQINETRESLSLQGDPVQAFQMIPRHARQSAHREPYILVEGVNSHKTCEVKISDLLDPTQLPRTLDIQRCIEMQFSRVMQRRLEILKSHHGSEEAMKEDEESDIDK